MRREAFNFCDFVRLVLEISRYSTVAHDIPKTLINAVSRWSVSGNRACIFQAARFVLPVKRTLPLA